MMFVLGKPTRWAGKTVTKHIPYSPEMHTADADMYSVLRCAIYPTRELAQAAARLIRRYNDPAFCDWIVLKYEPEASDVPKICSECHGVIPPAEGAGKPRKTCSSACAKARTRRLRTKNTRGIYGLCDHCGNPFYVPPYTQGKRKFCYDKTCRADWLRKYNTAYVREYRQGKRRRGDQSHDLQ